MGYTSYTDDFDRTFDNKNEKILRLTVGQIAGEAKRLARVKTGQMRQSVDHENDDKVGVVGTNKEYAIYNEYGTNKMSAAPFMRPAADKGARWFSEIAKRLYGEI